MQRSLGEAVYGPIQYPEDFVGPKQPDQANAYLYDTNAFKVFSNVTVQGGGSLTAWLKANSMVIYLCAGALFVLAAFGGRRK